jgi:hypothetical protein
MHEDYEIERYELSHSQQGLVAHCVHRKDGKPFDYHVHSGELSKLERWIRGLLKERAEQAEVKKLHTTEQVLGIGGKIK